MRSKILKQSYKLSLQTEVHSTGILYMGFVREGWVGVGGGLREVGVHIRFSVMEVSSYEPLDMEVPWYSKAISPLIVSTTEWKWSLDYSWEEIRCLWSKLVKLWSHLLHTRICRSTFNTTIVQISAYKTADKKDHWSFRVFQKWI